MDRRRWPPASPSRWLLESCCWRHRRHWPTRRPPEARHEESGMRFVSIGVLLALSGCIAKQPPLPILGQVPGFELTAETGQPFDRKSLDGKVWVADFIYTTCPGPCPRMSSLIDR